ncbi:MAG: heat-inducible transcriptional repressor HrcA [Alphaproteobacteria bacterium]|nr:heat-inducible transcriptional repressor HrcA [Alphaproteobacteria bacterium]
MAVKTPSTVTELSERSREIFRHVVETYLESGEPVGSRTISQHLASALSAASVRNVMSDLERMGLLVAPHTSAGRLPTEKGLRLFIDGLLELGDLSEDERISIEARLATSSRSMEDVLAQASSLLSGLSSCAGLVVAPKIDEALKHVEFIALNPGRALVILVSASGQVENRVIDLPAGTTPSALTEASNYLNARLAGRTLEEAKSAILGEIKTQKAELDALAARVVEAGLATWSGAQAGDAAAPSLIVRGQSKLLEDLDAVKDIERIRLLFDDLETKRELIELMSLARDANGVRIFIGSENKLFSLSGSSVVIAPYSGKENRIVGVIGVIGPTRINYARVIPMVDYTARVVGRLLSGEDPAQRGASTLRKTHA